MIRTVTLDARQIEYELVRKNVKNINLRIKTDGSVRVSANNFVSVDTVERFMRDKADFIIKAIDKSKTRSESGQRELYYVSGETLRILGKYRSLRVEHATKNAVFFTDGTSTVLLTVRDTEDTDLKRRTVDKWQKQLCRELIEEICRRVYPIFEARGVSFPELHFKTMRTRWGSCNSNGGSLNFNYALIHVPLRCIEYVVMHEFVHFLHPDHSKNFYGTLSSLMPDWKQRKTDLEKEGASLI